MAATYSISLPTDKDWVRFLVGDTAVTVDPQLQDEEIIALLADETATGTAKRYYVAATVLATLQSKWAGSGRGVLEKWVDELRITRGFGQSAAQAITARISELRREGARRSDSDPFDLKLL